MDGLVGSACSCGHRRSHAWPMLAGLIGLLVTGGCGRTMTITQDRFINTMMHVGRSANDRTGNPLEVNIVYVYPPDLEKPANQLLHPDSGITSDVWFKMRPRGSSGEEGRFDLPPEQIYLYTDETDPYGKKVGPRLKGAEVDGRSEIEVTGDIAFRGPPRDQQSVIYVFPRFLDEKANVLKTLPAKWDPPGDFGESITLRIGVREPAGRAEQFIENTTRRQSGKHR